MNTTIHSRAKALLVVATIAIAIVIHSTKGRAQAGSAPTDPQIVGIVVAADSIDIDYGKLAISKTKDKQVKEFAQQMVTDHSAVQKSVNDLATRLNVSPEDSETSNSLKTEAQQMMQKLQGLKGKEFDRAYIDNEVAYHQAVINVTKTVLIPSSQNAELKSALQGAEPLFEGHLQHAERVQSTIERAEKKGGQAANSYDAAPTVNAVVIRDFRFEPATLTVHKGDAMEWKNNDSVPHTATENGDVQKPVFDLGTIQTEGARRYVAQKKGRYEYICTLHPNMHSTLIVE